MRVKHTVCLSSALLVLNLVVLKLHLDWNYNLF